MASYLRPREAAAFLRTTYGIKRTPGTLCKLRCLGGGPSYVCFNREILYPVDSLHEWARGRISERFTSTSECKLHARQVSDRAAP